MTLRGSYLPLGFVLGVSLLVLPIGAGASSGLGQSPGSFTSPSTQAIPPTVPMTEAEYFSALKAADDSTFRSLYEPPFLLLLSKAQREEYLLLDDIEDRKTFISWYWKATNPDPLLPENDWLAAFLQRCAFAWENFAMPEPPYFDDRGKYYIKYGKPSFRYEDSGGFRFVEFLGRGNPQASYTVLPNETWSYENVAPGFLVHFVKEGTFYREIPSLTQVLIDRRRVRQALLWSDLIKKRASVSPVLGRAAMRVEELETALRHAALSGRPGLLRDQVTNPQERVFEIVRKNEAEVLKASRRAPPSAHDAIRAKNRVIFTDQIAQFRAADGQTRVEVALLAPLRKNLVKRLNRESADTLRIEYALLLRDRQYNPVVRAVSGRHVPLRLAVAEALPNAVGFLSFIVPPGSGDLTLQVEDVGEGRLGFRRQAFTVRNFQSDSLMVSDILLLAQVNNSNQLEVLPTIEREGLHLSPYPYLKVRKSKPLFCYFEVYNLERAGVTSGYEVAYKVASADQSQTVFDRFTRLLGSARDAAIRIAVDRPVLRDTSEELISIDLQTLPNGRYRLEITITSKDDARASVTTAKELIVTD